MKRRKHTLAPPPRDLGPWLAQTLFIGFCMLWDERGAECFPYWGA